MPALHQTKENKREWFHLVWHSLKLQHCSSNVVEIETPFRLVCAGVD